MKVYSVFWKSDQIILFESGESKSCPELPKNYQKYTTDKIPDYKIRVASFPTSVVEENGKAVPKKIFESEFDCWDPDVDSEYNAQNIFLERTHISNARKKDVIIFENFDKSRESDTGFFLLDVKHGKMKLLMKNRDVRYPSISDDGKKVAFVELPLTEDGKGNEENNQVQERMVILDLETGVETSVITLLTTIMGRRSFGEGGQSVWSKDNRYLFFAGAMDFTYTTACEKTYINNKHIRIEKEFDGEESADSENDSVKSREKVFTNGNNIYVWSDEKNAYYVTNLEKGVDSGHCLIVRGTLKDKKLNADDYFYREDMGTAYTIHKYYTDYGLAVRLLDMIVDFSINPEKEEILASRQSFETDEIKHYLYDYSGQLIKEVDYKYVENYKAIDANGNVAGTVDARGRQVPVLLETTTDKERIIIARKEDRLAIARHHFDKHEYDRAKEYYEEYRDKYGLPVDVGDRLLMLDTYRKTMDYGKMFELAKQVPAASLAEYFRAMEQK